MAQSSPIPAEWTPGHFATFLGPTGCLLYRLLNGNGDLLYVGISRSPLYRWEKHRLKKVWWPEVTAIECEAFPSEYAALVAELRVIKTGMPFYNIRGAVA